MSNCKKQTLSLIAGNDFELLIRHPDGADQLIDFTGWTASLVGRWPATGDPALFTFTQADQVEFGTYTANYTDHNIRLTIPAATTLQLQTDGIQRLYLGLYLTPPASLTDTSPIQVITSLEIQVTHAIAP